jgi:diphosphomevalonate decarboxylase
VSSSSNRSGFAVAVAHPNIALSKYWGKRPGAGNVPAVPSLSVTLSGLSTTTSVTFDPRLTADSLELNGVEGFGTQLARAKEMIDRVRAHIESTTFARIVSRNDFPTASGLASSASGFAALALAAVRAAGLDWSADRVADLARQSSASAARSIFGGFVELDGEHARPVAPKSALDLRVLVCVTTEAQKGTSSTDGMKRTADTSPYYAQWLDTAPRIHHALREALLANDFAGPRGVGELAESSALAMHASAMAAGVVYVSGVTLAALAEVRAIRESGIPAYATIDAGPHLKCLVQSTNALAVKERLARVPGVLRIIEASPGDGARILEDRPGSGEAA